MSEQILPNNNFQNESTSLEKQDTHKTIKLSESIELGKYVRPKNFKEYLKQDSVKKATNLSLTTMDIQKKLENFTNIEVHIKNYCKLLKHIKRLEFNYFNQEWLSDVNYKNNSEFVNLNELEFIPGRVEHIISQWNNELRYKKNGDEHVKVQLGYHY
jgi:hypothetical protein